MRRGLLIAAVMAAFTSVLPGTAKSQAQFIQDDKQFQAAIQNHSTSPSFVLISVVDGRNDLKTVGCTLAAFLIDAIHSERHLGWNMAEIRQADDEAIHNKNHVFTFYTAEALAKIRFDGRGYSEACDIIRRGHPALMSDRSGAIVPGQM